MPVSRKWPLALALAACMALMACTAEIPYEAPTATRPAASPSVALPPDGSQTSTIPPQPLSSPHYVGLKPTSKPDVAIIGTAGDISCESDLTTGDDDSPKQNRNICKQADTAQLLAELNPDAVLPLGDNQYPSGDLQSYITKYGASWGKFKPITYPILGNHEYGSPNADGFFTYFAAAIGANDDAYYSYDLASWHVVALNSECEHVACGADSDQVRWLQADLAAHPAACTLVYWHKPRFTSGDHGSNRDYNAFWEVLTAANADVVLSGHDHDYERFQPLAPDGSVDLQHGVTEFVVGTGGNSLTSIGDILPGSAAQVEKIFGILALTLSPGAFSWEFQPISGTEPVLDSGTQTCH